MVTWSNGSLSVSTSGYTATKADTGRSSGKWFWELTGTRVDSSIIGISNASVPLTGTNFLNTGARWYYGNTGEKTPPRSNYAESYTTGDVIGILLDLDNGTLTYYKNGVSQGVAFTDVNTLGEVFPTVARGSSSGTHGWLANFGASEFSYLPNDLPSGTKSYDDSKVLVSINKTLILHDGIYKKWIGEVNGTSETTTSIPIMTSNTAPSGIASSSSYWANDVRYLPYRAFNGVVNDGDNSWYSATTTNEWLAYEFTSPIIINEYSISPSVINLDAMPKDFVFEGFENGAWIVLDSRVGISNWEISKPKSFITKNTKPFIKYRLRAFNNNGNTKYIGVADFKMFKAITTYQNIKDWVSVNLIDVKTEGMDSLAPLLDRKVMQLEPQVMDSKIGILQPSETGKVFSKTISLNKYMDIKKIEVK